MHTDNVNVFAILMLSFVIIFNKNKHYKLIKEKLNVLKLR